MLSWNCRGLRNARTVNSLKSFLRATRAQMGFLTETRCDLSYSEGVLLKLGYKNFIVVPAIGLSGGIWFFWDDDLDISIVSFSKNLIHAKLHNYLGATPEWDILCFYGPPNHQDRQSFWTDMSSLTTSITVPFPYALETSTLLQARLINEEEMLWTANAVQYFNSWITDSGLVDLGFVGPAFTWNNQRTGSQNILLDWIERFGSTSWMLAFSLAGVMHLPMFNSDHCPILMKTRMSCS